MNLVLSGPIDDSLRNLVVALVAPRRVVRLHARADRLEGAADDVSTRARVATLCDAARVDHAYVEEGLRFSDFKLLVMDMDSTLITIECIDEIADFAGKKAEVAAITEAAMRGEIDFGESLRRRVAALAGTPVECLSQIYSDRLKLTAGASQVLNAAKRYGTYTVLLSGGFTYFSERLKSQLGLDAAFANSLEVHNGLLTGRLDGPLVDADAKAQMLKAHIVRLAAASSLAIGDGANDILMMRQAQQSVAFHAKPVVQRAATTRIEFGDLRIVLDYYAE